MSEGGCGDDGIFEEGAGATAVLFSFDEEHAFRVTNLSNGVVDLERTGRLAGCKLWGEVSGEVGVGEVGRGGEVEPEGDLGHDITAAMGRVEDTLTVGEAAGLAGERDEGEGFEVECTDGLDRLGDLLTVGPDVLDGGASNGAGDAGKTLDAADSLFADVEDKGVPVESGGDGVIDEWTRGG